MGQCVQGYRKCPLTLLVSCLESETYRLTTLGRRLSEACILLSISNPARSAYIRGSWQFKFLRLAVELSKRITWAIATLQCFYKVNERLSTLTSLLERGERETGGATGGLWSGGDLNLLDVVVAPWIHRATIVLAHYRAWRMPEGEKFRKWVERLLKHPAFLATTSTEDVYLDSYER